jgi:hypothetical protein
LGSYDAPGGISGTDFDNIGDTGGMTGNCITSFCRPVLAALRETGVRRLWR